MPIDSPPDTNVALEPSWMPVMVPVSGVLGIGVVDADEVTVFVNVSPLTVGFPLSVPPS